MKRTFFLLSLLALSALVPIAPKAEAQVQCVPGKECQNFKVSYDDKSEYGIAPSKSSVQFYDNQATKDQICKTKGYDFNPGEMWARTYNQWSSCNGEYHADWRGYWDIHKCGGVSYLDTIICARTPAGPTVDISVNPTVVSWGDRTNITWTSKNATSCTASGDWNGSKATSGTEESGMFLLGGKTFTITCVGQNGEQATDSASAQIDIIPSDPFVSWDAFPNGPVASGAQYTIRVAASDADNDITGTFIQKDNVDIANGYVGAAYTESSVGPKTIVYTAWAKDSRGKVSNILSRSVTVSAPPVVATNAPTISWSSSPSSAASGASYRVEATASDADGNLATVSVDKDNVPFAYAGGGNGASGSSGNNTSDTGPKNIQFKAWATDSAGNRSADIYHTVSISAPVQAISASVSASPSCVAPGGTISVTGNATGSGISSNSLEKDSNNDGVYGSIASRGDAGATSASVSVPANETSNNYAFRVNANGTYSSVANVSISKACPGQQPWYCVIAPWTCGGNPVNPGNPGNPVNQAPSVSISASTMCATPNSSVTLTSTANGSPINSNIIQKDSPAANSQFGDGVFGTVADYGSSGGSHSYTAGLGGEGYYDFKAVVNGSVSSSVRVRVSAAACGNPGFPGNPGNPGFPGNPGNPGGGNGGGGGPVVPPPILGCMDPNAFNYNPSANQSNGSCTYAAFTLSASPSTVKARSLAGYSGQIEQSVVVKVNPVYGFNVPVQLQFISYPSELKPEFSFDGGQTFSSSPTSATTLSNPYYSGIQIKMRFNAKLENNKIYPFTIRGTGLGGGKGTGKTADVQVNIDSRPLFPDYQEV